MIYNTHDLEELKKNVINQLHNSSIDDDDYIKILNNLYINIVYKLYELNKMCKK